MSRIMSGATLPKIEPSSSCPPRAVRGAGADAIAARPQLVDHAALLAVELVDRGDLHVPDGRRGAHVGEGCGLRRVARSLFGATDQALEARERPPDLCGALVPLRRVYEGLVRGAALRGVVEHRAHELVDLGGLTREQARQHLDVAGVLLGQRGEREGPRTLVVPRLGAQIREVLQVDGPRVARRDELREDRRALLALRLEGEQHRAAPRVPRPVGRGERGAEIVLGRDERTEDREREELQTRRLEELVDRQLELLAAERLEEPTLGVVGLCVVAPSPRDARDAPEVLGRLGLVEQEGVDLLGSREIVGLAAALVGAREREEPVAIDLEPPRVAEALEGLQRAVELTEAVEEQRLLEQRELEQPGVEGAHAVRDGVAQRDRRRELLLRGEAERALEVELRAVCSDEGLVLDELELALVPFGLLREAVEELEARHRARVRRRQRREPIERADRVGELPLGVFDEGPDAEDPRV
jgi:hypothetical protein